MDAGKIKSVTSSVRADASGEHASARRPDAGIAAARMVSAFLLDASSDAAESGALTEGPSAVPRDGIVVNLSRGIVAAEKDLQLARSALRASDYSHLDPNSAAALRLATALEATREPADVLRSAMLAGASVPAQNAERAGAAPASTASSTSADLRPDLYPQAHLVVPANPERVALEQKTATSAVSQARDAERLAGLTVRPDTHAAPTETHLGKLILGAIALGVLVVILL
ncbi:MAG: hypothetical protein JWM26_1700 [Betaproteobacteria bacterium]|nr:hypothetical protein [Betaproteobacteria bacterium]